MRVLEFRELVPVVTPLGRGYAMFAEINAHEHFWTVVMESGTLVTFTQDKIRIARSYTYDRGVSDQDMEEIIK